MIELAPELEADVVRQAATRGVGVDAYAGSLIESAARLSNGSVLRADSSQSSAPSHGVVGPIGKLRGFGKAHRLSLGEMTIWELRHEGVIDRNCRWRFSDFVVVLPGGTCQ
jgi:hypothetical protein